jgi:drug/metabolite transporter (DMT)-like permease
MTRGGNSGGDAGRVLVTGPGEGAARRGSTRTPIAAALLGAACISSSAVVMKLASTSASITALGRCVFALPLLGALVMYERRRGAQALPARGRWLARLAGAFLAVDLIVWSHTIDAIGAGLGTVVTNLEVLIISLLAWAILGERPRRSLILASPVMLAGLVLVGGLADFGHTRGYGTDPALGVGLGLVVAFVYAIYILTLRQATFTRVTEGAAPRTAVAAPLFEATIGCAVTAAVLGLALHDYRLGPAWPTLGWLALLALTSQVIGWLLITVSMPRLPAGIIGALLLVQPAGSVALSYAILGERPSALQLVGVVLILTGVLVAVGGRGQEAAAAEDELMAAGNGEDGARIRGYSRRRTRIMRQASVASTGASASKSP